MGRRSLHRFELRGVFHTQQPGFARGSAYCSIVFEVASCGGCGDSVVIDVRPGPSNGAVLDFFHEAPNETFDKEPLAPSLTAFLERVAEDLLAGRSPFYWY